MKTKHVVLIAAACVIGLPVTLGAVAFVGELARPTVEMKTSGTEEKLAKLKAWSDCMDRYEGLEAKERCPMPLTR